MATARTEQGLSRGRLNQNLLPRRRLLGVILCALLLGGSLLQSAEALAGFGTSPRTCITGEHFKEATVTTR